MHLTKLNTNTLIFLFFALAFFEFMHRLTINPLFKNFDELVLFTFPMLLFFKNYRIFIFFPLTLFLFNFYKEINFVQLLLDFKFFLVSFLAIVLTKYRENRHADRFFIIFFYAVFSVFIFEFLFNPIYEEFLVGDYIATYLIGGVEYHRFSSIFVHPGELAVYCVASLVSIFYMKVRLKIKFITCSILILMLFLTFQRSEILVFVILLVVFFVFPNKTHIISVSILMVTSMLLYSAYIYFSFFEQLYLEQDFDPRTAMYIASFDIFSDNFLSGIGPGNFASHMSVGNYYYYDETGISYLWWFDGARYLTDTFWPKIFSEYGTIGFFVFTSFIYYLLNISKNNNSLTFMLTYLFIISLQSPIFFNAYLFLYVVLLSSYTNAKNQGH